MNRVQKLIDENKDKMPTALAKQLLDACKEEADSTKKLYKLTWTMVDSHAHVVEVEDEPDFARVKLSHKTQTLIVSAVDQLPDHPNGHGGKIRALELPNHGMVLQGWVDTFTNQPSMPRVMMPCDDMAYGRTDKMVIVNSIVPYCTSSRSGCATIEAVAKGMGKTTSVSLVALHVEVEVEDQPNHAEVELSHKTQTLIVEAVDELPKNQLWRGDFTRESAESWHGVQWLDGAFYEATLLPLNYHAQ